MQTNGGTKASGKAGNSLAERCERLARFIDEALSDIAAMSGAPFETPSAATAGATVDALSEVARTADGRWRQRLLPALVEARHVAA